MKKYYPLLFILLLFACNTNNNNNINKEIISTKTLADSLTDVIIQHPDSLLLKENLIQYYREQNNYEKAIKSTRGFIFNDSLNPRLWHIYAVLLLEQKDTVQAINTFRKTIDLYPNNVDLTYLASIYANQKNDKALIIANLLLKDFKEISEKDAFFIKGLYYTNTNNKSAAITYFNQCLALDFNFMEAYREKAIALADLKKHKEAIVVLIKATTLNNHYDEGYFYLGEFYKKINNNSAAIESYNMAILYNPDNMEAKEALSQIQQ